MAKMLSELAAASGRAPEDIVEDAGLFKEVASLRKLRVAHATVIEWCMLVAGRIAAFLK